MKSMGVVMVRLKGGGKGERECLVLIHNLYLQYAESTEQYLVGISKNILIYLCQINTMMEKNASQNQQIQMSSYSEGKEHYRKNDQTILRSLHEDTIQTIQIVLKNSNEKRVEEKSQRKLYRLFYVDPLSRYTALWNVVIIFAIYLFQIQISLTLAFGPQFWGRQLHNYFYTILYLVLLFLLCVDVVINFNKGFYAFGRGKVIDDTWLIIKNYLKMDFIIDIISIGALAIPLAHNDYYLNFIQLAPAILLYFKKFKCQRQITSMIQSQKNLRIFFVLLMLGIDVLLIGHFGACIFVGLDLLLWRLQYYGNDPQYYWLSNNSMDPNNLFGGPWVLQYVYAQSFSTGTLSTVAPGPFPKNLIEVLYGNLVMIFFMFLASYAAEVIVSVLISESEVRTFHEENIQKFDKFLKLKGVSNKISQRVNNFFELIWETQIKMNVDEQRAVLEKLPATLKEELIIEMEFIQRLRMLQFFSNKNLLIRVISMKVQVNIVDSGTTFFREKSPQNSLDQNYIIHFKDGLAKYYIGNSHQELTLALSNVQRTVGQFELVTGLPYLYSCKSIDLCIISKVAHSDVLTALKENQMIEQFHVLRYKLLIDRQTFQISKFCMVCQGHHTEQNCYYLNPSLQIKDEYMQNLGLNKSKRSKYTRRNLKQKKERKIDNDFVATAIVITIFLIFRGFERSPKLERRVEQICSYEKYFEQFNLE